MATTQRSRRILMALPDRRVRGGPPSHLYLLRDSLRDCGVEVRGFVYGGRTHSESMLHKLAHRLLDLIRLPVQIVRFRPDIVHLNSAFDRNGLLRDVFFAPFCKLLGQRVVIKFHGSDEELAGDRRFPWRLMTKLLLWSCDTVFLLSNEERAYFERSHPGPRYRVVKNALEFSRYAGANGFRKHYDIPADRPLLLFIARFIEPKGIFDVIRALPEIRKRHDVFTAFVGDGPVRAEAEALCRELELTEHVAFTGYIPEDETVGAYDESDMLVLPTYHSEGMPMVLFHSMASKLPIITTRIRAAADWMEEGRHCLFVPPRDVPKLITAIERLLDDPELGKSMGMAGKELVSRFDRASVAREFVALYEEVMCPAHGFPPEVAGAAQSPADAETVTR